MVSDITVVLTASASDFMAKMGAAQAEVTKLGTKGSSSFAKLATVGKAALFGTAAAAVVIGVESVKAASNFQSAMELIRTQAGGSQAEVNKMSQAVLNLAGKTATAPDELAKGLYHLESSGMRGARAMQALTIAAEGAKVGNADLESVTNALNAVIASGIDGAKNMSAAMGMMNATVGAGDMRMQDLADAMGTGLLAAVKGFGVGLKGVSAALAVFGDNNIRGAQAGTELRMAVQAFAKPAAGGAAALKHLGLTSSTLAHDMQTGGLIKAVRDLHAHLVKAGDSGKKSGQILTEAFGKKAGIGIQVLEGQVGRFNNKVIEVTKGSKKFGSAWGATQKTFKFQVQQLQATVEALGIKLGTFLIPKVLATAKAIAHVVTWFQKHTTVAKILAAAIGTVLVVAIAAYIAQMAKAVGATIADFAKMIWAGGKWVVESAASMAETAALWAMYAADWIATTAAAAASWLATQTAAFASWTAEQVVMFAQSTAGFIAWGAKTIATATATAAVWIAENVAMAAAATAAFIAENAATLGIVAALALIVAAIVYTARHWSQVWGEIKHIISIAVDWIKSHAMILGAALGPIGLAIAYLSHHWSQAWGAIKGAVSAAWGFISPILHAIGSAVSNTIGAIGKIGSAISHIPGASAIGGILGHIPGLAAGGIVHARPGGTLVNVGEGGQDEAVIPLDRNPRITPLNSSPASATPMVGNGDVVAKLDELLSAIKGMPREQQRLLRTA